MRPSLLRLALTLACLSRLAAPALADDHDEAPSILARAAATGKARTFVTAVYLSGLLETLRDDGPFTVFVPTDSAFANLPESEVVALLQPEKQKTLASLLSLHVVRGKILATDITRKPRLKAISGGTLTIAANSKGVAVNEATIVQTDLVGRNGVVHLINRVLTPAPDDILTAAEKAGSFKLLLKALEVAGLEDALRSDGPFTVFAPTDEAFSKLGRRDLQALLNDRSKLSDVLKLHVLPGAFTADKLLQGNLPNTLAGQRLTFAKGSGRGPTVNGVAIAKTDLKVANGIIHVIDGVLTPEGGETIISAAKKAGQFTVLLKALDAAGLTETLSGEGPFTVLAPTDEAFEKLGEKAIKAILADKHALAEVLKYHVIAGKVSSRKLISGGPVATLQGSTIEPGIAKGRLKVNASNLVDTDLEVGKSVIHVIDRVLIPTKSSR